jgi:hypothetical protein
MPVTERFVLVLVVVLVLEFVGAACWDIALRWYGAFAGASTVFAEVLIRHSPAPFTTGQTPIVHHSVSPLPRLIEDEDDDENEYDSKILPDIADLLQGISTLI